VKASKILSFKTCTKKISDQNFEKIRGQHFSVNPPSFFPIEKKKVFLMKKRQNVFRLRRNEGDS
jgi:hypothetical protein